MKTTKCGSVFNKKPKGKEVPAAPVKKAKKRAKKKGIDPNAKKKKGKQSKFSSKYSERIKSIKES